MRKTEKSVIRKLADRITNSPLKLFLWFVIFGFLGTVSTLRAVEVRKGGKEVVADRINETITVDGQLRENVWLHTKPIQEEFYTYNPVYGQILEHKTKMWVAYDDKAIYFAFDCNDPDPSRIKTSITHRDNILNDDVVGVLIDSMGTKQSSYEFYVNPSGMQHDYLNYGINIEPDDSPDFVWHSAGKIISSGYQVEIAIPLETLRYTSGSEVRMGVLFLRNITRLGLTGTWPETHPGQTDF